MRLPLLFASLAIFASCKQLEEPPPPPFRVAITVQSDKDVPLPGVVVRRGDKDIGKTEPNGKAILSFRGEEGDQIDVWVKCPEGFDSPTKPTTVALRRLADQNKVAEYPVMCPPAERKVIVAVRTDNGPNLPVKYLGREIARTDTSGATTFMLNGKPGDHMEFTVDTTEKGNDNLRPQNPAVSLVVDNKDNYYQLDQPFQVQRAKIVYTQRQLPRAIGPTPLRY
jgi:hypothetical protein